MLTLKCHTCENQNLVIALKTTELSDRHEACQLSRQSNHSNFADSPSVCVPIDWY